jgi:hypothetical protein
LENTQDSLHQDRQRPVNNVLDRADEAMDSIRLRRTLVGEQDRVVLEMTKDKELALLSVTLSHRIFSE